jgi:hypothetical protein
MKSHGQDVRSRFDPLFIIGASRSGSTMLRLMINGHPGFFIPPEAWFVGELVTHIPNTEPLTLQNLEQAKKLVISHPQWPTWKYPEDQLDRMFSESKGATLPTLIDRLFREVFQLGPQVRWGEKSPRHSHICLQFGHLFPSSQFIHIIRDGRDSCASMLARDWYGSNMIRISRHWSSCVHSALQAKQFGPSRYQEVRFQKLLEDPGGELGKLCSFLHVNFHPRMLEFNTLAKRHVDKSEFELHEKLFSPISLMENGKWEQILSFWQEALFWAVAEDAMKAVGNNDQPRMESQRLIPLASFSVKCFDFVKLLLSKSG